MSATRIVVTPEIPGPTAPTPTGKPAAEKPQAQQQNNAPAPQQGERPQWLPEKFQKPEDLASAYAELEKKLGAAPKPEGEPKPDGEGKPNEQPKPDEQKPTETDKAFEPFFKEFSETGKLSDESYAALAKQGISKAMVDAYARGVQAEQQAAEAQVFEAVGGKEKYSEIVAWAAKNLKPAEINAFNSTLETGTPEQIALAAQGLQTRYQAANGRPGSRIRGNPSGSAVQPFRSTAEVTQAMSDPRYKTDQAYRDEVAERLRGSTVL